MNERKRNKGPSHNSVTFDVGEFAADGQGPPPTLTTEGHPTLSSPPPL